MRTRHIDSALVARLSRAREDLAMILSRAPSADADALGRDIKAVATALDAAACDVGDAAPDTLPTGMSREAFAGG